MTTMHDDDIRALLAPISQDTPTAAEISQAIIRAGGPERRRGAGVRRGIIATGLAGAGAALAAVAFWPASDPSQTTREPSIAAAFMLASASAAEQIDAGTYRFTRLRVTIDRPEIDISGCKPFTPPATPEAYPAASAAHMAEFRRCAKARGRTTSRFTTDQWVDTSLQGRQVWSSFRETDEKGRVTTLGGPRDEKFMFGDALIADSDGKPISDLDDLPTAPAQLEPRLAEIGLRGYLPSARGRARDHVVVQSAIALLTYPKISSQLRAAAFGVLARIRGFRDLGETTDALGRRGRRVEITGPASGLRNGETPVTIALLFDTDRAELLSWTETTELPVGKDEVRTTVIEIAGNVTNTTTRP